MNILLVDDNADYVKLLADLLYANGYTVYTAADGLEGCEILASTDIDLIISDIKMPRFDGIKLHGFVRTQDSHARTKFIFMTAFTDTYKGSIPLDPELDIFLDKSTSVKEIVQLVDKLMFGKFAGLWN
jgi:DNA-binding response OmpR family regulator